jgi:hypothetical protein
MVSVKTVLSNAMYSALQNSVTVELSVCCSRNCDEVSCTVESVKQFAVQFSCLVQFGGRHAVCSRHDWPYTRCSCVTACGSRNAQRVCDLAAFIVSN